MSDQRPTAGELMAQLRQRNAHLLQRYEELKELMEKWNLHETILPTRSARTKSPKNDLKTEATTEESTEAIKNTPGE